MLDCTSEELMDLSDYLNRLSANLLVLAVSLPLAERERQVAEEALLIWGHLGEALGVLAPRPESWDASVEDVGIVHDYRMDKPVASRPV